VLKPKEVENLTKGVREVSNQEQLSLQSVGRSETRLRGLEVCKVGPCDLVNFHTPGNYTRAGSPLERASVSCEASALRLKRERGGKKQSHGNGNLV
jgi:hypothetical protein